MEEGDSGYERWKSGRFAKGYDPRRARAPRGPKSKPRPKSLREALRPDAEYIRLRLVQLSKGLAEDGVTPMDPEVAKVALKAVELMAKYSSAPPRAMPEEPETPAEEDELTPEERAALLTMPEEAKA